MNDDRGLESFDESGLEQSTAINSTQSTEINSTSTRANGTLFTSYRQKGAQLLGGTHFN